MGDPTLENQTASTIDLILNNLIEGAGQDAIEASLITSYPWMGLPFIKQLMEFILSQVSAEIYQGIALSLTKIIIDIQVNLEESKATSSFQNLQMALASGDQNAIKIASADLSIAYGNIIHSDGSASP